MRPARNWVVAVIVTSAGAGGDRPLGAVAFGQIVRLVEAEVPASWLVVVGGEVDGLDGGAEQMLAVQRLVGVIGPPCDAGAHGRRCQLFA
jgi:hypothetical protein